MYLIVTAATGLFAALLMFCGDMLLYFTTAKLELDGTFTPFFTLMKTLPNWRLRLGGLLGPIAAFFYCIGYLHLVLAAGEAVRAAAVIAALLACLGIIVGGAYHSHFTYFGMLGRIGDEAEKQAFTKNISLLSGVSLLLLAISMLIFAVLIVLGKTSYPQWFIVLTPLVTYFLSYLLAKLPQPFKVILAGGWYNLMYVIFFGASLLMCL